MNEMDLALRWLTAVGKEQVQTFQDNFAAEYDISMCLLSLAGEPLTVWSNRSLLCHFLQEQGSERCAMQSERALQKLKQSGGPVVDTCFTGVTAFLCPVYLGRQLAAAFLCGPADVHGASSEMCRRFAVPRMTEARLHEILRLLTSILAMIPAVPAAAPEAALVQRRCLMARYPLSEREATVVCELARGRSNREIAETLYISEKTVKTHVSSILRKMQAKDRAQVMLLCHALEQAERKNR